MPVHREKETTSRQPRTTRRETSITRTSERPIITQTKLDRKAKISDGPKPESKRREATNVREDRTKKAEAKQSKSKLESQRLRTRTRTLSPTEVKQLTKERISKEIVKAQTNKENEPGSDHEDENVEEEYEDDFEDYESDFEEESGNEEEVASSSSEPVAEDTPEPIRPKVIDREMEEVIMAMKMENEIARSRRNTPEIPKESVDSDILDFSKFRRKSKINEAAEKSRRRGRDLLSMITLDAISYSFLEIPSVPYEVYMKIYGKSDTKQVSVQTNEDNLDEETQTDFIETCNKWVQKPPGVSRLKYRLTKEERLGVGSDRSKDSEPVVINTKGLNEFLQWATRVVLPVLQKGTYLGVEKFSRQSKDMYFSDGFITLNVSQLSFLKGKSVVNLWCRRNEINTLLSVHTDLRESFGESAICVWNTNDLSKPLKVLKASNRVTSVCSVPQGLVFAGLSDGTVCLWDLKESSDVHKTQEGIIHQSPTYTTAQLPSGHVSSVTSIHVIEETQEIHSRDFTPIQLSTLEEKGVIIIWSVVLGQTITPEEDLGLAHWGKIKLVKSSAFSVIPALGKDLPLYVTCNDLALEQSEDVEMYVTNSLGTVTHVSKYGTAMKPKSYKAGDCVETTCLEICPFNPNYFLAGCKDGTIRSQEMPLISLNGSTAENDPQASIVSLAWLLVRPFVFFALDSLSRIHIWDLGLSDMYPEVTLTLTKKKICCVSLIQSKNPKHRPHFVLGTADGKIEIHKLKEDYGQRPAVEIHKDVKKFLKYVSIL